MKPTRDVFTTEELISFGLLETLEFNFVLLMADHIEDALTLKMSPDAPQAALDMARTLRILHKTRERERNIQ